MEKNPDNFFVEGQGAGPRQRVKKNSKKPFLCRGPALSKEFFKNPENFFAEGQGGGPRQRFLKKIKKFICRGSALGKQIQKKNHFFAEGRPSAKKPPTAPAPDGFFSLPRAVLALGKGFAEGCHRQRPLGEFLDGEGVFAEGSLSDTRQSLCRGPGRPSAKKRGRQAPAPLVVSLLRAHPRQRNGFFLNLFAEGRPSANIFFNFF